MGSYIATCGFQYSTENSRRYIPMRKSNLATVGVFEEDLMESHSDLRFSLFDR